MFRALRQTGGKVGRGPPGKCSLSQKIVNKTQKNTKTQNCFINNFLAQNYSKSIHTSPHLFSARVHQRCSDKKRKEKKFAGVVLKQGESIQVKNENNVETKTSSQTSPKTVFFSFKYFCLHFRSGFVLNASITLVINGQLFNMSIKFASVLRLNSNSLMIKITQSLIFNLI